MSAVAAAVVGVGGGGMSAYVSATFIRSQEAASAQMRAYFSQPLDYSRTLAAERLIADLPGGPERDRALVLVVERLVGPGPVLGAGRDPGEA